MLLAIDVGNTNIVLGVFDGPRLAESWRLATMRERTADEIGILVTRLFERSGIPLTAIDGIILSSVVPPLTRPMEEMAERYFGRTPLTVDPAANSGFTRYAYLKFDVGGLADAQNVKLKLVPFQVDGAATLAYERLADDTWSESALTWNNRPTAAGTLAASLAGYAVGQQVEIDLTDAVRAEAAGDGVLSLRIANDGWNFIGFHSRESATPIIGV